MKFHVVTANNEFEALSITEFDSVDMARAFLADEAEQCAEGLGVEMDSVAVQWQQNGDMFVVAVGEQQYGGGISVLKPFVEACLDGDASIDELDKYIEWWHTHDTGNKLHEFLGISLEDYGRWLKTEDEAFFQMIIDERKMLKTVDNLVADAAARTQEDCSSREVVDLVK